MASMGWSDSLRTIFSFFLGLMMAAFIGVGVYTFHSSPERFDSQIRDLVRREQAIRNSRPPNELEASDRDQIQEINRQRNDLTDAAEKARKPWVQSTSIILMVFATLTMAISLVRPGQLPVISNGLLLGGVFTMLYSVGWIVASDTSITRFLVMTAGLLTTLGLGYLRFVRRSVTSPVIAGSGIQDGEGFADVERRVRVLEERMNEAAHALGHRRDSSSSS